MKIILVHCHYQQPGGEDVVVQQERQMLERAGHQVVLYLRNNFEVNEYPGAKRLVLLQKAIWNGETRNSFSELLRSEKPDIVHVHNTWIMISPSIYSACRDAGVPVIRTLHNYQLMCPVGVFFRDGKVCEECMEHSLLRSLVNRCYRDSAAETAGVGAMLVVHRARHTWDREVQSYIVPTEFARSKFLQGGLPPDKLFVKPNFVTPDPLPRTGDGSYAIFAGRLAPERRVNTLLNAWTHLRSRIPLVIVGGGVQLDQMRMKASRHNLDSVEFTGLLEHGKTVETIKAARFLIFTSEWYETFGLTLVEAFACGVPVICSRRGAMQEIVEDGRTGLHFNPGDSQDLAEKVEWAWNHPERMREMGEEARREYEKKYTAEKNYPRLMEIYEQAIAQHRAPALAQARQPVSTVVEAEPSAVPEPARSRNLTPGPVVSSPAQRHDRPLRIVLAHNFYQIPGGEDETFRREQDLLRANGHYVNEYVRRNSEINWNSVMAKAVVAARAIWAEDSRESMRSFLKQERPDVAHFHNTVPLMSPSVYYSCREAGVPVVQTLHNPRLFCPGGSLERNHRTCEDCKGKKIAWPAVVHACYRQSHIQTGVVAAMLAVHWQMKTWDEAISVYIVTTQFYRRKFIEAGFPAEKLMLKPHFVEDPGVVHRDDGYAVFVGRLSPEKGIPTLLRACAKLSNIPIKIRGEGPLLPEVQEVARTSGGMVGIVPRLGRAELNTLISGARFLIWPSEGFYETFGYVAAESFACGVPVIASRIGVAEEIVCDQQTGVHFNAGDSEDLAAKIKWAWAHPNEMERMGRAARAEYEAKYTPERNYPMLMDIYNRVLSSSSLQNTHALSYQQ
jgi:glycosyltransferase involved in cell wall biosynthesis